MDRSKIRQLEDGLFAEWKQDWEREQAQNSDKKHPGFFVTDGMVNPEKYENIVFVLKEVNGGDKDWDLRRLITGESNGHTWNNIARWTRGLTSEDLSKDITWKELDDFGQTERNKELQKIATMNLKKIAGTSEAKWEEIEAFARNYEDKLQEQLSLYEPKIIICCGTGGEFIEKDERYRFQKAQQTNRGVWYRDTEDEKIMMIFYSHPNARTKSNLLHYALMDAVREIKEKRKNNH